MPPVLRVLEAAFGVNAVNRPADVDWAYVGGDVPSLNPTIQGSTSGVVRSLKSRRGRHTQANRFEAGSLSVVLDNRDGRFDPENPAGPYFGHLLTDTQVRWRNFYNRMHYTQASCYNTSTSFTGAVNCTWTDPQVPTPAPPAYGLRTLAVTNSIGGAFSLEARLVSDDRGTPWDDTKGYPCAAGETVTGVAGFQATAAATTATLSLQFRDGTGTLLSTVTGAGVTDTAGSWTAASVTAAAPAGTLYVSLKLSWAGGAASEVHNVSGMAVWGGTDTAMQYSSIVGSTRTDITPGTFAYNGVAQQFVVPKNVTTVFVDMWGGQGGARQTIQGAAAGRVQASLAVTPGEWLQVNVGGAGGQMTLSPGGTAPGGFNGGGASGQPTGNGFGSGSGGGGATDVRQAGTGLASRVLVAGGGGGQGSEGAANSVDPAGGLGGSLVAGDGADGVDRNGCTHGGHGTGGTQAAGGTGGAGGAPNGAGVAGGNGLAGASGQGGVGGNGGSFIGGGGGGGGGGFFGGGGGGGGGGAASFGPTAADGGGAGGGSSFAGAGTSAVTFSQGAASAGVVGDAGPFKGGNGGCVFSWKPATSPPTQSDQVAANQIYYTPDYQPTQGMPAFTGLADGWQCDYQLGGDATCTLTCSDGFKSLQNRLARDWYAMFALSQQPSCYVRLNAAAGDALVPDLGTVLGARKSWTVSPTVALGVTGSQVLVGASNTCASFALNGALPVPFIAQTEAVGGPAGGSSFAISCLFMIPLGNEPGAGQYATLVAQGLFPLADPSGTGNLFFGLKGDGGGAFHPVLITGNAGANQVQDFTTAALVGGQWYNLSVIYSTAYAFGGNAAGTLLLKDGVTSQFIYAGSTNLTPQVLVLGNVVGGGNSLQGLLDEVAVYTTSVPLAALLALGGPNVSVSGGSAVDWVLGPQGAPMTNTVTQAQGQGLLATTGWTFGALAAVGGTAASPIGGALPAAAGNKVRVGAPGAMDDLEGTSVLSVLQDKLMTTAYGYLFVRGDGTMAVQGRYTPLTSTSTALTLTDQADGITTVPYRTVQRTKDATLLQTRVQITQHNGPTGTEAANLTAVQVHGDALRKTLTTYDASSTNLFDEATWYLQHYAEPPTRIGAVQVPLHGYPAVSAQVLLTELQQLASLTQTPPGVAQRVFAPLVVAIEHSVTPVTWTVTLTLDLLDIQPKGVPYAVLDLAGRNVLDSCQLAF